MLYFFFMRVGARAVVFWALMGSVPGSALAQGTAPTPNGTPPAATGTAPAAPAAPPGAQTTAPPPGTGPAAPSAAPAAPPRPVIPATGYGWTPPPKHKGVHVAKGRAARARPQSPDAIMPGFETLADGSTRLFVELTKPVTYDTKAGHGTVTLVLKGAHVDRRNNYNPLITVHFNTPVTRARLVPHGKDLWFVVDLRANVQPTVTMDTTKEGGAMVRLEFPKGNYLPAAPPPEETAPPPPPAAPPPTVTPPVISSPPATRR